MERAAGASTEPELTAALAKPGKVGKQPQKHIPYGEQGSNPSPCPSPALSIFSFIRGGSALERLGKSKHPIQGKSRRCHPSLRHIGPAQVSGSHHVALGSRPMPGLIAAPGGTQTDPLPQSKPGSGSHWFPGPARRGCNPSPRVQRLSQGAGGTLG